MQRSGLFRIRARIRRWRLWGGVFHLASLFLAIFVIAISLPKAGDPFSLLGKENAREQELRQELLVYMDRLARYQHYYRELNGRFTRDLSRLGVPEPINGIGADMRRVFEISVLELSSERFTLIATGRGSERVTIDERHRLYSNFPLPKPTKQMLYAEAQRQLVAQQNKNRLDSIFSQYWELDQGEVVGLKAPVLGERKTLSDFVSLEPRADFSLFETVSQKLRAPASSGWSLDSAGPVTLRAEEILLVLQEMKQAMHIFRRERGYFPTRWEELDQLTGYGFTKQREQWSNLRLNPIEINDRGYFITIDGTKGDLQGEQFILDQSGSVRQIRYTEAIIKQLEQTTAMLNSALGFSVTETKTREPKPFLDRQKSKSVESKTESKK